MQLTLQFNSIEAVRTKPKAPFAKVKEKYFSVDKYTNWLTGETTQEKFYPSEDPINITKLQKRTT
jgi:hypothetical protein